MQPTPPKPFRSTCRGWALSFSVALCVTLFVDALVSAGQRTGYLAVTATVQPYVRFTVSHPGSLILEPEDLAPGRGYVDVPNHHNPKGTALSVNTNDRTGYTVVVSVVPGMQTRFASIEVTGLGQRAMLPGSGGSIAVPYTAERAGLTLGYRLNLAQSPQSRSHYLSPGTYPWPILISLRPNNAGRP